MLVLKTCGVMRGRNRLSGVSWGGGYGGLKAVGCKTNVPSYALPMK